MSAVPVVDDGYRLVGNLSLIRLVLVRPNDLVGDLANAGFISVSTSDHQKECVRLMERYNLNQLPVVDPDRTLTGGDPGGRSGGSGESGGSRRHVPAGGSGW